MDEARCSVNVGFRLNVFDGEWNRFKPLLSILMFPSHLTVFLNFLVLFSTPCSFFSFLFRTSISTHPVFSPAFSPVLYSLIPFPFLILFPFYQSEKCSISFIFPSLIFFYSLLFLLISLRSALFLSLTVLSKKSQE